MSKLLNVKQGQDADLGDVTVESLTINGTPVSATSVLLGPGDLIDLNGEADGLVLDADADTSISAPTDDQIDIELNGADDFTFTPNKFTALSGSAIETNTINETTPAAGVTIDGALLKDGRSNLGRQVQALTESGAITIKSGLVTLAHDTVVIAATLAAPTAGDELIIADASAAGTAAHTVTLPAGVTFDGTNNTATLNAPGEALHIIALSATRWFILENIGSVGLSNV
jgi:hypothetical protein